LNGSQDESGRTSQPLLSEMRRGLFQRLEHVLQSLEEHSELPDEMHSLSSPENAEPQLAATICTAYFTWMIADMHELLSGGELHTVSSNLDDMIQHVQEASTSQSTSLKNPIKLGNLRSTPIQGVRNGVRVEYEQPQLPGTNVKPKKKATKKSKGSKTKSSTGKKRPSVKKKKRKSKKRSGRKKRS